MPQPKLLSISALVLNGMYLTFVLLSIDYCALGALILERD